MKQIKETCVNKCIGKKCWLYDHPTCQETVKIKGKYITRHRIECDAQF